MKAHLGHVTHTWGSENLETIFSEIAEIGYEGVELFDYNVEKYYADPAEFQALLDTYNLVLSSIYCELPFIDPDKVEEEKGKAEKAANFLTKLNANHLIVGPGPIPEGGIDNKQYQLMAKSLNKIGKICLDKGVEVCFHPHVGGTVENREQIRLIFDLTDPDLVFFALDTGHLAKGGSDPVEVAKTYQKRIRFIHLKDMKDQTFVELGLGNINNRRVLEIMNDNGYNGWILPEIPVREGTPIDSAKISFDYLKNLLPQI